MFDTFTRAVRASKDRDFAWHCIRQYASRIPHETSPRAIVLVLPYIRWGRLTAREDLIRRWAAAASAVPCTEEVAQSVVDTLLQIASQEELIPHIPADAWLWLAKRPSLPPICRGRDVGTRGHVVRAVRALKDIEAIKSYFLLVWSEWSDFPSRKPEHTIFTNRPDSIRMMPVRPGQQRVSAFSRDTRRATDRPTLRKRAEIHTPASMLRYHPPNSLDSISIRRPRSNPNRTPDPYPTYIPGRAPDPHPSYIPYRTSSPRRSYIHSRSPSPSPSDLPTRPPSPYPSDLPTRPPSPYPSDLPTRPLSPHPPYHISRPPSPRPPYHLSRPPSPHRSILTRAPSPYPPTIPDHKPSYHSPTVSDKTSNRHPLSPTPNPRPPYYPTTLVVINRQNRVSDHNRPSGFDEMKISIREDFGGIEMGHHRADLIRRLDHVLERLNRGLGYFRQHNPAFDKGHLWRMKDTYRKLRETLLRVDEAEVIGRIAGSHTTFMCALPLP